MKLFLFSIIYAATLAIPALAVDSCRYTPGAPPCTLTTAPDLHRGSGRIEPPSAFDPCPKDTCPEPTGTRGGGGTR